MENCKVFNLREISVTTEYGKVFSGHFHCWCKEHIFEDGQYVQKTYALIELKTGAVQMINPLLITFLKPYGGAK